MDPWQILGIIPTQDTKLIESAYHQKKNDPQVHRSDLNLAYEAALNLAADPEKIADAIFANKAYREDALLAATFSNDAPSPSNKKVLNVLYPLSFAFLVLVLCLGQWISLNQLKKVLGYEDVPPTTILTKPDEEQLKNMSAHNQLRYGIAFRNSRWVQDAIAQGVDVNGSDDGKPLFQAAVETGHPGVLDAFLQGKPNPKIHDAQQGNALHWAIATGNPLITRKLHVYGVDAQHPNSRGITPIEMAKRRGETRLVKILSP